MKIRILGFEPIFSQLPKSLHPTCGFDWMRENPGSELRTTLTAAVVPLENWMVGVMLKSRDAKSFTKMLHEGGIKKVKAEKVPDGQRLTEANFFVVHPQTGRGLYAYHYSSASMTTDFHWACAKTFDNQRRKLLDDCVLKGSLTGKEKAAIRKQYAGRFSLSQLLINTRLKEFLSHIKRVSSFEASFTSFDLEEDIFDPLSKRAKRKTVKFQFPPDLVLATFADELEASATSPQIENFCVEGVDRHNKHAEFNSKKNPLVFEEYDYDELLGDLEIRFNDWEASIAESEVTKKLLGIAKGQRVGRILSTTKE